MFEQVANDPFTAVALPIFALAVAVEAVWSANRNLALYDGKDFLVSMSMLLLSAIVDLLPKVAAFMLFIWLHELSPLRDIVVRQWWAWVLLFFLDDFIYYWFHRANHEVRLLWAGHVAHHSSQ